MSIFDKDIIRNEEDINRLKAWEDFCKAISKIDEIQKNTVATFMITNSQIADEFNRLCEEDFNKIFVLKADLITNGNFITNL